MMEACDVAKKAIDSVSPDHDVNEFIRTHHKGHPPWHENTVLEEGEAGGETGKLENGPSTRSLE